MAELDTRRNQVLGRSACIIQRKIRTYIARKIFISLRTSAIQIQAFCRGQGARYLYERMRREGACLRIQRHARKFLARKSYKRLCSSAVSIQTGMRGMAARIYLQYRKQIEAATRIQSHCRRYLARIHYMRSKRAATAIQCAWRGKVARRELRKLKMAAKETGALQAAKSALEKQVEELTWRLQLEKRMRADMEEAKDQENSKLKSALEEMRLQFQETKELLMKEHEASKKAAEQAPIIKEVSVTDDELVKKLTTENEELKALVDSLEKKIDETEKKYEETSKLSEERLKQAMEAESKIIQLKTAMQSLEEKLADMETEDQILRQQALLNSRKEMSENLSIKKSSENGHLERATPSKKFGTESFRKSMVERQREQVDALMKCITQDLGFSEGKPVATFTIYKCLIHWKSFEAERTSVFDRLIQVIGSAIEDQTSTAHMAYWVSNTSMLLFLLQQTLKSTDSPRKPPPPTSLFGRMTQGFRSFPSSANLSIGGLDGVRQVEAKYPALLFKQQLAAYVEKIYGIIRDIVKKDLSSLISSCIQAPRTSKGKSSESGSSTSPDSQWQEIIDCLNGLLNTLKENHVPLLLVQKIFTQIFSSINVQLFNSLLLHKECCTFSNGECVKSGLDELELWCGQAKEEYAGSSWDELKPARQAVGFLVIHQKSRITYDDLTNDLCPILSVQQLYRICTLYRDDNYNTPSVDQEVISSMKVLMTEDPNESDSSSFLLDDNASIPFSIDDICSSLKQIDFKGVKPAAELLENPEFQFLQE